MMIKLINNALLSEVTNKAKVAPRRRTNYNFHSEFSDPINRMLNAVEPGSYVQPHKHENPDKREVFILLSGRMAVLFFDDEGNITDRTILDRETNNLGVEIPPKVWHTIIALVPATVVFEIKDGPYSPVDDKNFANWAPKEGETGCDDYLAGVIKQLGLI